MTKGEQFCSRVIHFECPNFWNPSPAIVFQGDIILRLNLNSTQNQNLLQQSKHEDHNSRNSVAYFDARWSYSNQG